MDHTLGLGAGACLAVGLALVWVTALPAYLVMVPKQTTG